MVLYSKNAAVREPVIFKFPTWGFNMFSYITICANKKANVNGSTNMYNAHKYNWLAQIFFF